ncbi:MAG TPA: hypothetical protein PKL13_01205 [bacterium]|nr:hypothetical protein [bacterium]
MKKLFIITLIIVIFTGFSFLIIRSVKFNKKDSREIQRVNYLELQSLVSFNKDFILIIGGRSCYYCKIAENSIKKSFDGNRFKFFKKIEYKDLQTNQLINKESIDLIPLTLIIKNGVVVEKISGFREEIYIPKLDSLIVEHFE